MIPVSGFRGSGFSRFEDFGVSRCMVGTSRSGFGVFEVRGFGFRGLGFWVSSFQFRVSRLRFEVLGVSRWGFRVSPSGFAVRGFRSFALGCQDFAFGVRGF